MRQFVLGAAGALLAGGIVLSGVYAYNGQLIAAASIVAGACAGFGCALGFYKGRSHFALELGGAALVALSVLGAVASSPLLDISLQSAQVEVRRELGLVGLRCMPMSPELYRLGEFGTRACSFQPNSDQLAIVGELAKSLHFGPVATLADSGLAQIAGENVNYCAKAFVEATRLCPTLPIRVSLESRAALVRAAQLIGADHR